MKTGKGSKFATMVYLGSSGRRQYFSSVETKIKSMILFGMKNSNFRLDGLTKILILEHYLFESLQPSVFRHIIQFINERTLSGSVIIQFPKILKKWMCPRMH